MAEPRRCPYCNTQFHREQAATSTRGPSCPRCLEPLTALAADGEGRVTEMDEPFPALRYPPPAGPPSTWKIGIIVLSVLIAMSLLVLGYAFWPTPSPPANNATASKSAPREPRKPTELIGLGFLPKRCNLVAGIQFDEIENDPQASKLLANPRPPYLNLLLTLLESGTGLKVEDLDHAVLGANLKSLSCTLVVATRKNYDIAKLAKLLGDKIDDHQGKPVYALQSLAGFKGNGLWALLASFEGRVWCPDSQVLVLAIRLSGNMVDSKIKPILVDDLPFPPWKADEGLSEEIKDVLTKRLDRYSLAWVAGHNEDTNLLLGFLGASLPPGAKDQNELKRVKRFGLILRSDENQPGGIVASGQLSGRDEAGTRALAKFFQKRGVNIAEPPADAHGPDACWIGFQKFISLQEIRSYLGEPGSK